MKHLLPILKSIIKKPNNYSLSKIETPAHSHLGLSLQTLLIVKLNHRRIKLELIHIKKKKNI